jgi:hypothetical protein
MRRVIAVLFAMISLLFLAWLQAVIDPFGFGTATAERFSWGAFAQVKPGMSIDDVVLKLGRPVRSPERLTIINTGRPEQQNDPCFPQRCMTYHFAARAHGFPPTLHYSEALVIVGPDRKVVASYRRDE